MNTIFKNTLSNSDHYKCVCGGGGAKGERNIMVIWRRFPGKESFEPTCRSRFVYSSACVAILRKNGPSGERSWLQVSEVHRYSA